MIQLKTRSTPIFGQRSFIAKRGSREISSAAYRFVKSHCKEKERLSFWCDNCGGQNKNQYIAMAMIYTVNAIENVNVIDIRSPYKGHTFLSDDLKFRNIEKKFKATELLHSVDDYVDIISQCYS